MAKAVAVVNVRVEEKLKHDIERLYDNLGMNISTAVNMFFKQCLMEQGLPYQPKIKQGRVHKSLKDRLKDYDGDYKTEEWDTGTPVGREIF
ncbi:MAG: type II toxin-antitoxin system RelB/DinJ family antitoxin [Defluviitaleaceae bacterium]|nr:type II toxin-antitoxin system RelB/DinJ family antitoxin [Defluviitaleaceae bacterium]